MDIGKLDTPCLVMDKKILIENIKKMFQLAEENNVKLRPHIKAHKCSKIADLQLKYGAVGIAVAKLTEAEVMFKAGIEDILVAYQIVTSEKIAHLENLIKKGAKISCLIDDQFHAVELNKLGEKISTKIPIYVEVDSGLKRTGLAPQNVIEFIEKILDYPYLQFRGILTHAGQVYGVTRERVAEIGCLEGNIMENIAKKLQINLGRDDFTVSVGSTPTVKYSAQSDLVTEIRPGNYVFNDAIQLGLGVVDQSQCSLKVLSTVISKPTEDRLIIDAGSKTLALDKGAHGTELVEGYGLIDGYPNLVIERLSEEHGIVKVTGGQAPEIGEKILIIPNHACPVVNLADYLIIVEDNQVVDRWLVDARGKNK